jgi:hypothetical protein
VRFQTVSGYPARARWPAIAVPIVPSPTNPTRSNLASTCRLADAGRASEAF